MNKPKIRLVIMNEIYADDYYCPTCGAYVTYYDRYCSVCGQQLDTKKMVRYDSYPKELKETRDEMRADREVFWSADMIEIKPEELEDE